MSRALTVLAAFLVSITTVPSAGRGVSYDTLALGRIGSFSLIIEAMMPIVRPAVFKNP